MYCKTGLSDFCRIADFNSRGFLSSLYSELEEKMGFPNFAVIYFRGLNVNRKNNMSAEKNSIIFGGGMIFKSRTQRRAKGNGKTR